jgi:hypothetical protein
MSLPLVTASSQLSHRRHRTGDHKIWDAEYTRDLMDEALTPDCQLEVHLWRSVAQSRAEAQPIFRLFRNHDTQSPNVGEVAFSEV